MALVDTPLCDFGWKAPDFTLSDPHGNTFTMRDQIGENGLLIAFICNHCPYVKAIAERLAADTQTLKSRGVNTLAIMPNDYDNYPADAPPKMIEFAAQHGFEFPYLVDEDQQVARACKAVCTPDFFGLNSDGELEYRGRIDDAKMGDPSGRTPELLEAFELIATTGRGPEDQSPSMGCSIKWA